MSSALNNFQKRLRMAKPEEFRELCIRINRVNHCFQFIEKRLSFLTLLIFWNAFGFSMVTVTKFALSKESFTSFNVFGYRIVYFAYHFYVFLKLVLVSAKVDEAGIQPRIASYSLSWDLEMYEKEKFIIVMKVRNLNTTFTLWRIGELKKGFILTSCSALISYFVIVASI
ncbi:hypothetical protein CDAR_450021 [Caerostris darwini]|uniref:Uncharacterized protein n=1 Tax=Caerostris darwini TaxID=1538125 RepID=A0AAV4QPX0_9ARAC|nr:hypothetical protein CDAR_450021 [Caerostris darwini]